MRVGRESTQMAVQERVEEEPRAPRPGCGREKSARVVPGGQGKTEREAVRGGIDGGRELTCREGGRVPEGGRRDGLERPDAHLATLGGIEPVVREEPVNPVEQGHVGREEGLPVEPGVQRAAELGGAAALRQRHCLGEEERLGGRVELVAGPGVLDSACSGSVGLYGDVRAVEHEQHEPTGQPVDRRLLDAAGSIVRQGFEDRCVVALRVVGIDREPQEDYHDAAVGTVHRHAQLGMCVHVVVARPLVPPPGQFDGAGRHEELAPEPQQRRRLARGARARWSIHWRDITELVCEATQWTGDFTPASPT